MAENIEPIEVTKEYKVRRMTVWQRLHVLDLHAKLKDEPFTLVGEVIRHGIESWKGLQLETEDYVLQGGRTCKVLTDDSVAKILEKKEFTPESWNDVLMDIYKENKFPFFESSEDGEQR